MGPVHLPVLSVLTIEGSHVHGDGGDEALALVELALQQLAEHVQRDELVAVQDGALREGAETKSCMFSNWIKTASTEVPENIDDWLYE